MSLKAIVEFINYKDPVEKSIEGMINRAVARSVKVMERNIKLITPKVEGNLARSIHSYMTGFAKGEVSTNLFGEIDGLEVNYAVYVEYGTKYFAPRAMFRKGVAQSEDRIKQIFAEEAKKTRDKYTGNV